MFHPDSYGYRPGKSALDAVGMARQRCWAADWVIDLDIKGFFDSIPDMSWSSGRWHNTPTSVGAAVHCAVACGAGAAARWHAGAADEGTPQGGVVSPLLANLFLHYAFDLWMRGTYPGIPFERYADDAIVHCRSERQRGGAGSYPRRFAAVRAGTSPDEDADRVLQRRSTGPGTRAYRVRFPGLHLSTSRAKNRRGKCLSASCRRSAPGRQDDSDARSGSGGGRHQEQPTPGGPRPTRQSGGAWAG